MINLRQRTGYSFRSSFGKLPEILACVPGDVAAITDRASTFGHIRFADLCAKANKRPIFGVELAVVESRDREKQATSHVTFLAHDSVKPIYELFRTATSQFYKEPRLTWNQVNAFTDGEILLDDNILFDNVDLNRNNISFMVHSGSPLAVVSNAIERGCRLVAASDNHYPTFADRGAYEILTGRMSGSQTYPQHLLNEAEWRMAWGDQGWADAAVAATYEIAARSLATLPKATIFKPERPATLLAMCLEGAARRGMTIQISPEDNYMSRLNHELKIIKDKDFEDYFYIIADLMREAKSKMLCGPARGSSAGSLVCYLLGITDVDPIRFDLIFERFIDINRTDLPDIDIDLSDVHREEIFAYLNNKYGEDHVARLGTAMIYKAASTLNETAGALRIPRWEIEKFKLSLDDRAEGDARVYDTIHDGFESRSGYAILDKYPELRIAERIEGHPRHASRHAAGIVITADPVINHVGIDNQTNSTQCEKRDAETIGLLKIDLLGLTQLSIFEHCLQLIGKTKEWLQTYPLDDKYVYEFFNKGHLTGIFQFNGPALRELTRQIHVSDFEDLVALTSLARPGPMDSGITAQWVHRKNGTYPAYDHPSLVPILKNTLGCCIYQEQVMRICREIGNMSWKDVSAVRKAMGKSMGAEYMEQWRDRFVEGANSEIEYYDRWDKDLANQFWGKLCKYGAYGFNRSHAVAYSMISYWCAVLKFYHPLEFAAATLSTVDEKDQIFEILKDLDREGIKYKSIDVDLSEDKWVVRDGILLGPLSGIRGIGPAAVADIIQARFLGKGYSKRIDGLLANPTTEYDVLYPIKEAFLDILSNPVANGIVTPLSYIGDLTENENRRDIVILAEITKIDHRDKNDEYNLKKRDGQRASGDTQYLSLKVTDDTGTIPVNISTWKYNDLAKEFIDRGVECRPVYILKGMIGPGFRMIHLDRFLLVGQLAESKNGQADKEVD